MKPSKVEFQKFKKACLKYIDLYGLMGWDIHITKGEREGAAAFTTFNEHAMMATIHLVEVEDPKDIDLTAKHEVLHLFLGRLGAMARNRFIRMEEIEAAEHEIIAKLEKLL